MRRAATLRHRFQQAYYLRAYPDNDAVLRDLINKRDELANLVGRPNYATLNFEDRMLNTPDKVQALMDDMAAAAKPAARRDYAKKLALLQQLQPGATKLEPWDNGYVSQPRPEAILRLRPAGSAQIFQLRQCPRRHPQAHRRHVRRRHPAVEDMPKWDKLVESYEVYDHGKLIGRFIFDSHPRDGKYEHANAMRCARA